MRRTRADKSSVSLLRVRRLLTRVFPWYKPSHNSFNRTRNKLDFHHQLGCLICFLPPRQFGRYVANEHAQLGAYWKTCSSFDGVPD
jgi:hypothetical protein